MFHTESTANTLAQVKACPHFEFHSVRVLCHIQLCVCIYLFSTCEQRVTPAEFDSCILTVFNLHPQTCAGACSTFGILHETKLLPKVGRDQGRVILYLQWKFVTSYQYKLCMVLSSDIFPVQT